MTSIQPTLLELTAALSTVSARWYDLGLRLDTPLDILDGIKATNHEIVDDCISCMEATLQWWLQNYPEKGWSDIAGALRGIDENKIADEVMKRCISTNSLGMI